MSLSILVLIFQINYFFYFVGINLYYLFLNISALFVINKHMEEKPLFNKLKNYSGFELPVSVIVPAYNEEKLLFKRFLLFFS